MKWFALILLLLFIGAGVINWMWPIQTTLVPVDSGGGDDPAPPIPVPPPSVPSPSQVTITLNTTVPTPTVLSWKSLNSSDEIPGTTDPEIFDSDLKLVQYPKPFGWATEIEKGTILFSLPESANSASTVTLVDLQTLKQSDPIGAGDGGSDETLLPARGLRYVRSSTDQQRVYVAFEKTTTKTPFGITSNLIRVYERSESTPWKQLQEIEWPPVISGVYLQESPPVTESDFFVEFGWFMEPFTSYNARAHGLAVGTYNQGVHLYLEKDKNLVLSFIADPLDLRWITAKRDLVVCTGLQNNQHTILTYLYDGTEWIKWTQWSSSAVPTGTAAITLGNLLGPSTSPGGSVGTLWVGSPENKSVIAYDLGASPSTDLPPPLVTITDPEATVNFGRWIHIDANDLVLAISEHTPEYRNTALLSNAPSSRIALYTFDKDRKNAEKASVLIQQTVTGISTVTDPLFGCDVVVTIDLSALTCEVAISQPFSYSCAIWNIPFTRKT